MANIKFSDFTVGNTEGDIDFVVGYKGANNIQISPTNLLASALGNYLPLAGGTMTGNVKFNDNIELRLGSGADLKAYHSGTHTYFDNNVGDLYITQKAEDKDIIFQADDGSGGNAIYFQLDGSETNILFSKPARFVDSISVQLGTDADLTIQHDNADGKIDNFTGDLKIRNFADDKDVIFQSDDGAGGLNTYLTIDGGADRTVFSRSSRHNDGVIAAFGSNEDLQIYHTGTGAVIQNATGNLTIQQDHNNSDIIFRCDDGSGGTATYFYLDGGNVLNRFEKSALFADNVSANFGNSFDLQIYHDGSNSYIDNISNHLVIQNQAANKDIIFKSDDGGGGLITYFLLDGSLAAGSIPVTRFPDNSKLGFGDSTDLQIYHNSTASFINNDGGDLNIANYANDKDIRFFCDDGSGSVAEYFRLDGSLVNGSSILGATRFPDKSKIYIGDSGDLEIFHNGSQTYIENYTGEFNITQHANDGDMLFKCDDGSGGVTTYFFLDGSSATGSNEYTVWPDSSNIAIGTGKDLQLYHNGSTSSIYNNTGNLVITNAADDSDIIFKSDDGSGGTATYFALDGGITRTVVYKNFNFQDNVKLEMGTGADLQLYHDGSNSYIKDTGTGDLRIWADSPNISTASGNKIFYGNNGAAELYFTGGAKKFETTSTGIKVTGVSEYADNTAAIAGGLTTGDVYRTGDLLKIVH